MLLSSEFYQEQSTAFSRNDSLGSLWFLSSRRLRISWYSLAFTLGPGSFCTRNDRIKNVWSIHHTTLCTNWIANISVNISDGLITLTSLKITNIDPCQHHLEEALLFTLQWQYLLIGHENLIFNVLLSVRWEVEFLWWIFHLGELETLRVKTPVLNKTGHFAMNKW